MKELLLLMSGTAGIGLLFALAWVELVTSGARTEWGALAICVVLMLSPLYCVSACAFPRKEAR